MFKRSRLMTSASLANIIKTGDANIRLSKLYSVTIIVWISESYVARSINYEIAHVYPRNFDDTIEKLLRSYVWIIFRGEFSFLIDGCVRMGWDVVNNRRILFQLRSNETKKWTSESSSFDQKFFAKRQIQTIGAQHERYNVKFTRLTIKREIQSCNLKEEI